jgi:cell wall-associated NlpC family hydrolase
MPVRRDLFSNGSIAHSSLQGQVQADRFADGTLKRVASPVAQLRLRYESPTTDRQILYGHPVLQLETNQGLSRDENTGYVGYVPPSQLSTWAEPTHRVSVCSTFLFNEPNFKAPNPLPISLGSQLSIKAVEGKYARTHDGLYAITAHLSRVDGVQPDLVAEAEKLLGTPYLWGGNSAFGIDCSGLVQIAMQGAGLACPGDSDQQMQQLGADLPQGTKPQRNDLMFWKGHVALVFDPRTLIHANAHHMCVAFEPISEALKRIEAQGDGPLLAHKRL